MDVDQERGDLNALIREAHEAIKDLHHAMKSADALITRAGKLRAEFEQVMTDFEDKVEQIIATNVHKAIDDVTGDAMETAMTVLMTAVTLAEENINERFDTLTKLLMFEEDQGERIKGLTLPEYIGAVRDYRTGVPIKIRDGVTAGEE